MDIKSQEFQTELSSLITTHGTLHILQLLELCTNEEEESFRLCKMLDANYVLVIFGGFSSYSGDDINKFIWIIRITNGTTQE